MVSASRNSVNCLSKSLAPTSTDRRTKTRCISCSRFHSFFLFDISRIRLRIRHRALFRRLRIRYPRPATFSDPAFDHVRAVALDRSARSRNRTTERRRSGRGPLQRCKSAPRRRFDVARSRISHAQILVRIVGMIFLAHFANGFAYVAGRMSITLLGTGRSETERGPSTFAAAVT